MIVRLFKNSVSLAFAGIVEKAAIVVLYVILARELTQIEFGQYSLVLTCVFMGSVIADFGIEPVIIREIAKRKEQAATFFNNAISISLVFSVVAWPVVVGFGKLLHYGPEVVFFVKIAGAVFVFVGISRTATAVIKAFERMEILAYVSFLHAVLSVILCVGVLWIGLGILGLIFVLLISEAIRAFILMSVVHYLFVPISPCINRDVIIKVLKQAVPFAVLMAYSMLHRKVDILIMGRLRPLDDVAIYGVAVKFADFLSLISDSIAGALFPAFSVLIQDSKEKIWKGYSESISIFAILGFGAVTFITALAKPITVLFFGAKYALSTTALIWLGWAFLFSILSGPVGIIMIAAGNQMRKLLVLCVVVIGINIALNLWLIPVYSYNGAAFATFVSTVIGFCGHLILLKMFFKRIPNIFKIIWRPVIAAVFTGVILKILFFVPVVILLLVGSIIYLSALWKLGEFKQDRYAKLIHKLNKFRN